MKLIKFTRGLATHYINPSHVTRVKNVYDDIKKEWLKDETCIFFGEDYICVRESIEEVVQRINNCYK